MLIEIRGGTIVTMNLQNQIIPNGVIRIEEGRIVEVTSAEGQPDGLSGGEVIDATGKWVLPGLINTHCHAAMTLFRSFADDLPLMDWLQDKIWPAENRLTGEDVYWGTRLAIREMVLGGITTFADMYFFMDETAQAVEESGIRAALSRGLVGLTDDASEKLREGVDFCRRWQGKAGGRITTMLAPHAPYTCRPAFLKEVAAAARELDCGLHIHLAETEAENRQIVEAYGKRPFWYLADCGLLEHRVLAAHGVWLEPEELDEMAGHCWGVSHNPTSNLKLASGFAPVPAMLQRGIPVGLGTDGAASNNRLDLWSEMKLAAILHKAVTKNPEAVPASTALAMATIMGAKALGLEEEIGSLEPGKRADLILVSCEESHLNPVHDPISLLVYAATRADVRAVMVDGNWLVWDGVFLPYAASETAQECNVRAKRLVNA